MTYGDQTLICASHHKALSFDYSTSRYHLGIGSIYLYHLLSGVISSRCQIVVVGVDRSSSSLNRIPEERVS